MHAPGPPLVNPAPTDPAPDRFDPTRRFVRVTNRRPDGLVEFEFAIGEPGISIEMALDRAGFEEFCANHQVEYLEPEAGTPAVCDRNLDWRLRDATQRRLGDA